LRRAMKETEGKEGRKRGEGGE
jgi:hypothetical protein